jgi:hypothetical protein
MRTTDDPREGRLVEGLLTVLRQIPTLEVDTSRTIAASADYGVDLFVDVSIAGRAVKLAIQVKESVFPRDVRAAFWYLRSASGRPALGSASEHVVPMLAARMVSEGAKQLLQSERIGYFEEGGSLFLTDDGLYILIDRPATKAVRKTERAIFSGNRSQVVHALLVEPEQWFSTHQLAALAHVSPSTASVVLGELEKRELLVVQGKGPNKTRKLNQPGALLDAWAKQTSLIPKPQLRRFYVPLIKPEQLLKKIDEACVAHSTAYVISHEWAAQLYTPFLSNISQVKCRIFPNGPLSVIARELNAREVEEGSNLGLIESKSVRDMLFKQEIGGVRVESPILTFLDLIDGEGRSREIAEHLRREKIGF